ncbi:hypothetical protein EB72_16635 [Mycobacterium sp. SWH-M1]|nr:hypothetical protein EB72_16635 [Mycobacterium sp. SWH-M1]
MRHGESNPPGQADTSQGVVDFATAPCADTDMRVRPPRHRLRRLGRQSSGCLPGLRVSAYRPGTGTGD